MRLSPPGMFMAHISPSPPPFIFVAKTSGPVIEFIVLYCLVTRSMSVLFPESGKPLPYPPHPVKGIRLHPVFLSLTKTQGVWRSDHKRGLASLLLIGEKARQGAKPYPESARQCANNNSQRHYNKSFTRGSHYAARQEVMPLPMPYPYFSSIALNSASILKTSSRACTAKPSLGMS